MAEPRDYEPTFELDLARQMMQIRSQIEGFIEKNPDLPIEARASLARLMGRVYPLCDYKYLETLRDAYER